MATKEKHPGRGWFTRSEMAAFLNVTESGFDKDWRRHAEPDGIKKVGRSVFIHARTLIDGWHAAKLDTRKNLAAPAPSDSDPLMSGPATPQLERYRRLKADDIEMDLEERRKSHVRLADLTPGLSRLAATLRRGNEQVRRKFGNEPADLLEESLAEFERDLPRLFAGRSSDDGESGTDGAAPDGQPDQNAEAPVDA